MKKIVFLGSKPIGYHCLDYLIRNKETLGGEVIGVLSNDNLRFGAASSVRKLSLENNIRFIETLDDLLLIEDIDLIISVQYHAILKQRHIDKAREIAVNLHMAPLPEYRGCNQFSFAIYNNSRTFGTTLHRLESGIDNGAIIVERRFEIPSGCLVSQLYQLTYQESIILFESNIGNIVQGKYSLVKQAELIPARETKIYFRKDIDALKQIDVGTHAEDLARRVRATSMPGYEPPYILVDGEKFFVIPARMYNDLLKG